MPKRMLAVFLSLVMIFSMFPAAAFAVTVDAHYQNGTYTAAAKGYENKPISVTVTVADGAITDITADGSSQTPEYWEKTLPILDAIKSKNGTDGVDIISGVTISAEAVLKATDRALAQAYTGFAGGSGTAEDPYLISGEPGLRYFQAQVNGGTDYAGQFIKLTGDVQLSEAWTPIGAPGAMFAGHFDGANHTISDLKISGDVPYAGFFGYVASGTTIKNLVLKNAAIETTTTQPGYGGTLVAFMKNDVSGGTQSVVDHCYAEGTLSVDTGGNAITMAGGLVGFTNQYNILANSGANVQVTAKAGGKAGNAGGLVGFASVKGAISNCYALGDVRLDSAHTGSNNSGGFIGGANGMIYNCYAAGQATAEQPQTKVGGIAGHTSKGSILSECYYDNEKNAVAFSSHTGIGGSNSDVGKPGAELKAEGFATLLHNNLTPAELAAFAQEVTDHATSLSGCDFPARTAAIDNRFYDWEVAEERVLLSSDLWASGVIDDKIFDSGSGTEADPYTIRTPEQLRKFAASLTKKLDYSNTFIALAADIDVSGSNWTAIGGSDYAFNGHFDGKGHTISGMTQGSEGAPLPLTSENVYVALFGVLDKNAVVKDVHLRDVAVYTSYKASAYVAGIAAVTQGHAGADQYKGAVIDGCSVKGKIVHTSSAGNNFVGGIVGMQYKGAVINCWSDVDLSCTVSAGSHVAEVGGLVALNNRGLVANSYALGNVYGSGSRTNGDEGMAAVSPLVAVQAGNLSGCYSSGQTTAAEHSVYVGMVAGWVTGIGKAYSCWYDLDTTMTINGVQMNPVQPIGTKVPPGVNEEGNAYVGGIVDDLKGYHAATYASIAEALNGKFSTYPAEISKYGVAANALKNWTVADGVVTFSNTYGTVTYVQPEAEIVPPETYTLQDGTWYGRDDEKKTVLKITVKNKEITATEVVSGEANTESAEYQAALKKAKEKSTYGDFTHYEAADPAKFAGGSGSQGDPYRIETEAQLRYLATSINADTDWTNTHFALTKDIALAGGEWRPIGLAIQAKINGKVKTYAAYSFKGHFDGGGHAISGLTIGSEASPSALWTVGLFGLTDGTLTTNDAPTPADRLVGIQNVHLKNLAIHQNTPYGAFAGGIVGNAQTGIAIDNCSVSGHITAQAAAKNCHVGGLAGSVLRGTVTDSWTDVTIQAKTDATNVYAGGLFGNTNRVTVLNSYALGNVTGDAGGTNKVHIGGLTGMAGGVQVNCYAKGDVISLSPTSDLGGINGRSGGIAADYNTFFNSDAVQKSGDTTYTDNVAVGVNANNNALITAYGKSPAFMSGAEFATLLNTHKGTIPADLAESGPVGAFLKALLARGFTHLNYYSGDGSDLNHWVLQGQVVTFGQAQGHAITLDANGGSVEPTTLTTGDDGKLASLPTPTLSNHQFEGWFTEKSGGEKVTTDTVFQGAATIYAHWTKTPGGGGGGGGGGAIHDGDGGAATATYTIKASAGHGGQISPSGDVSVKGKTDKTFTIQADENAVIEDVLVDGASVGAVDTYTFKDVSKDHSIKAIFKKVGAGEGENTPDDQWPFSDVHKGDWFYGSVAFVYAKGMMGGTAADRFDPNLTTTRGMIVTILHRLEGNPTTEKSPAFTDVAEGAWYSEGIRWAAANQIVAGYGDGRFGPDDAITREQMAAILLNYANYKAYDTAKKGDLSAFRDADAISDWAKNAMAWAYGEGLLVGVTAETIEPAGRATRAQAAAILQRFYEQHHNHTENEAVE